MTDYLLVSQDLPQVEHFIRQDDSSWKMFRYLGLDSIWRIDSIETKFKLSEIYDRIQFSKRVFDFIEELKNG